MLMHGTGDVLDDLLKVAGTVKKVAVSVGDEVRGRLPGGSMVRGILKEIQGDKAVIQPERGNPRTVDFSTVQSTDELANAQVVNQRQLREDMARPQYNAEETAIHQELIQRGVQGATVSEIATATGVRANEATITRAIRQLREDPAYELLPVGTDADGSSRYFVFPAGQVPAGFAPPRLGRGINEVSESLLMNWLSQNPGQWTVDEASAGLGLPNKGESISALVRAKLGPEGKVNVHKNERGRDLKISFNHL